MKKNYLISSLFLISPVSHPIYASEEVSEYEALKAKINSVTPLSTESNSHQSNSKKVAFEENDERMYSSKDGEFPWLAKCSKFDYRTIHGCLEARFFDPSARVYFDSGTDDPNEIDIFNDGGLSATIDFASIYLPWRFGRSKFYDSWSWGPMVGLGISSPAKDSKDGTSDASDSPVVLASLGLLIEYKLNDEGAAFGVEMGKAIGFSSDESFGDNNDSATYVGLKISIPTGGKPK